MICLQCGAQVLPGKIVVQKLLKIGEKP